MFYVEYDIIFKRCNNFACVGFLGNETLGTQNVRRLCSGLKMNLLM